MANDRIFARCKKCSAVHIMVKYYPNKFEEGVRDLSSYVPTDLDQLDDFFTAHLENCHPHFGQSTLNGEPGFDFVTESIVAPQFSADKKAIIDIIS